MSWWCWWERVLRSRGGGARVVPQEEGVMGTGPTRVPSELFSRVSNEAARRKVCDRGECRKTSRDHHPFRSGRPLARRLLLSLARDRLAGAYVPLWVSSRHTKATSENLSKTRRKGGVKGGFRKGMRRGGGGIRRVGENRRMEGDANGNKGGRQG